MSNYIGGTCGFFSFLNGVIRSVYMCEWLGGFESLILKWWVLRASDNWLPLFGVRYLTVFTPENEVPTGQLCASSCRVGKGLKRTQGKPFAAETDCPFAPLNAFSSGKHQTWACRSSRFFWISFDEGQNDWRNLLSIFGIFSGCVREYTGGMFWIKGSVGHLSSIRINLHSNEGRLLIRKNGYTFRNQHQTYRVACLTHSISTGLQNLAQA